MPFITIFCAGRMSCWVVLQYIRIVTSRVMQIRLNIFFHFEHSIEYTRSFIRPWRLVLSLGFVCVLKQQRFWPDQAVASESSLTAHTLSPEFVYRGLFAPVCQYPLICLYYENRCQRRWVTTSTDTVNATRTPKNLKAASHEETYFITCVASEG